MNVILHLSPDLRQSDTSVSLFPFTAPSSAGQAFQKSIIPRCFSNNNRPSFAPLINCRNLKVDQHTNTAQTFTPQSCAGGRAGRSPALTANEDGTWKKWNSLFLLVIDHFHAAVLLNPKLTDNDVVHTAGGVCPGVGFVVPVEEFQLRGRGDTKPGLQPGLQPADCAATWAAPE